MDTAALIRLQIDIVRNVFLKEGGWRYARSLYVMGSFARDEGTWDIVNHKPRIYNDVDILAIVRRKGLRSLVGIHRIQKRINDGRFGNQIDIVIESEDELQDPAPTIQNFDIQKHHAWLWGDRFFELRNFKQLGADSVSQSDALQLLFNRQASLLIGFAELHKPKPNVPYLQIQLSKPLFAMMAALLIAEGRYVVRVRDQLALIETERSQRRNDPLWKLFQDNRLVTLLHTAVAFKDRPEAAHFEPYDQTIEVIAKCFHQFMKIFMIHHYGLPQGSDLDSVVQAFHKHQPLQAGLSSPQWWACWWRCRETGLRIRLPGRRPHPHVAAYTSHLLWMAQHVTHKAHDWLSALNESLCGKMNTDLDTLINAWKVSGYGCTIK